MMEHSVIIATRGSELALWQAREVARCLEASLADANVEVRTYKTTGDRITDRPLSGLGDKGLFTRELEQALLNGEADLCVHSMKDLPTQLPDGCTIGGMLPRADARDGLVCGPRLAGVASLADVPAGSRIGTGSLRRSAQLQALFPQIDPREIRGNVETRLRKAKGDDYEGAILATAGLKRLGLQDSISCYLAPEIMVPAPGQGAIGIEIREGDEAALQLCKAIGCRVTQWCVEAERFIMDELQGGCTTPIGVYARPLNENAAAQNGAPLDAQAAATQNANTVDAQAVSGWAMDAIVLTPDGSRSCKSHRETTAGTPESLQAMARDVLEDLRDQGAEEILAALRELNPTIGHRPPTKDRNL